MATMSVLTYFNSKVLLEKEGRKKSNLFIGLIGVAVNIVLVYYIYSMHPNNGNKYSEAGFFMCLVYLFILQRCIRPRPFT